MRDDFGECSIAPQCHAFAECVLYGHIEYCNCKVGFSMTGEGGTNPSILPRGTFMIHNPLLNSNSLRQDSQICQDVDECTSSITGPCPGNANCVNNVGSFECICNQGLVQVLGDDGTFAGCEDLDECADKISPVCVPTGGSCLNTIGSYMCDCIGGFNGTGYSSRDGCLDLDECAMQTHQCGEMQHCINTVGSFFCECQNPGFEPQVWQIAGMDAAIDFTSHRCHALNVLNERRRACPRSGLKYGLTVFHCCSGRSAMPRDSGRRAKIFSSN